MKFRIQRIVYFYSGRIVFCPMVKKNFWSKWHYIIKHDVGFSTCKDTYKSTCFTGEAGARQTLYDYIFEYHLLDKVNSFVKIKSIVIK